MSITHWRHCLLALSIGLIIAILALATWLLGDLPAPTADNLRPAQPSTLIFDRNGRLLYEVMGVEGKQTPLSFDAIPDVCWQATVAVEDGRFFQHPGFDLLAIGRSLWWNLTSGRIVSGASTITQQLARNTLMSPEERYDQSYVRKLREAWLAWRIERRFSKEEILAFYLNQVYYGNFAVGLEAAAQSYYGKSASELDLAECSLLAGLLQNPPAYNPLTDIEAARWRQAKVLDLMVQHGYIHRQDAALALAERLRFAASPFTIEAPHFVSYVEEELDRLVGTDVVSRGGLRVYTTLDLGWQHQAEAIVRRRLEELQQDPEAPAGRRVDNAALVALDPDSGAILTMVGSPDYFDPAINGALNAALALRQPGSAIKPLTYAAAMDPELAAASGRKPLTAATVIADVRTTFLTAEGEPYVPRNYDLAWHGPVSVRTALASSYNLPAVKVLDIIGVDALIDQAQLQGINTFQLAGAGPAPPYGLALTLGGGEVSLLELTGAYAAFANGGYRVEPYAIEHVEDVAGNTLFSAHPSTTQARQRVLDQRVAFLITDMLADNDARAPSFGRNSVLRLSRPAAVKTGTTSDWRDNWTVGYTPDLVAGVWVGNADNTPMLDVSGVSGAGPIWHDFMEMAHHNRPVHRFRQPDGLVRVEVCADSGLLATDWCTRRRTELFIPGTEPHDFDNIYRPLRIDTCSNTLATPDTPPACIEERIYRVYPPELREWARANGIPQPPSQLSVVSEQLSVSREQMLTGQIGSGTEQSETPRVMVERSERPFTSQAPRCGPAPLQPCDRPGASQPPAPALTLVMTSPDPNSVYRLSPALPADVQQLRIAARPDSEQQPRRVTFLVDDQPVGSSTGPSYEVWWPLQRGTHAISAVAEDTEGRRASAETIWIEVQ